MKEKLFILLVIVGAFLVSAYAEDRASEDFVGPSYECDYLPTDANFVPVWDMAYDTIPTGPTATNGILNINTMPGSIAASYYMPGKFGAEAVALANRHYVNGDANNPWDPDIAYTGYTLEIRLKMNDSVAGQWGFTLYIGEAFSGCLSNYQIFKDSIKHSGGTVYYTGNLSGTFHTIRLVRSLGEQTDPFGQESIQTDIYVDGVLAGTNRHLSYGGTMVNAGWNQDWFSFGSLASSARYNVDIDYIRFDFSGMYTPDALGCGDYGYLKGDVNMDCAVNMADLADLAMGWMLCTDPLNTTCVDCTDPINAEICK